LVKLTFCLQEGFICMEEKDISQQIEKDKNRVVRGIQTDAEIL
jgi:hypothetical protein